MATILLIDDDVELSNMLSEYLEPEGFQVKTAYNGEQGLPLALSGQVDLVVLDVMMPVMNGIDTLRHIRANSKVPVIMLTGKGDDVDKIIGLELGADDYVPKPCTPRELTARIRAILRRVSDKTEHNEATTSIEVGTLRLWPSLRRAEWHNQPLELTNCEYSLLEVLARNSGVAVSKEQLSEQGLGKPLARFDRSVDVHISSIRQKLGAMPNGQSFIQTVFRQGYMLIRG